MFIIIWIYSSKIPLKMAKNLLGVMGAGRQFRINIRDIHKVFKVNKKPFPKIPSFEMKIQSIQETNEETVTMEE